jgi:hypothetical protein
MFDELKEPEDMFEKIDVAAPNRPAARLITTPSAPSPLPRVSSRPVGGPGFPWKVVLVVLIITVVIVGAAWLAFYLLSGRAKPVPKIPYDESSSTSSLSDTPSVTNEPAPRAAEAPPILVEPDADQDGLSDVWEASIGTSASSADTDGDGLFDREEVEVYKTNPLKTDTDGDSYVDGAEVSNGYDPNGSGKLFEVPASR